MKFNRFIEKLDWKQKKYITHPNEPIYYIIRRKSPGAGFFSNYFYVLSHIIYAEENEWIPVVDMENYKTLYSEKEVNGKRNTWEYFFLQPNDISLDKVYSSKNYVLSQNKYLGDRGVPVYEINQGFITDEMVSNLYPLQAKCIPIKSEIQGEATTFFERNVQGKIVIGVHVRGTDMQISQTAHSLPPKLEQIIKEIKKIEVDEPDSLIFLACDEEKTIREFQEIFPGKCFYTNAFRSRNDSVVGVHNQNDSRKLHKYLLGKEVLIDSLCLSKCNYLICGISNVTSAAKLFNNLNYKKVTLLK